MQSGIQLSDSVSKEWNDMRASSSVDFVKFQIKNSDSIAITASGPLSGDDFLSSASSNLLAKEPCYLLVRTKRDSPKFVLVYYVPSNARVHDKMLLSSTLNTFKVSLTTDSLAAELHIGSPDECKASALETHAHTRVDLMTVGELIAHESAIESAQGMATEAKVAVDLPVAVAPEVVPALAAVQSGATKSVTLTLNSETETLHLLSQSNDGIDAVSATFTRDVPRYCVFSHAHTHPETGAAASALVFVYYCPDRARPRVKMFHSAAKSLVVKVVEQHVGKITKSFEATEATEVSAANAMSYLYPVIEERKVHAKPKPRVGGGKKAFAGKFEDF